MDMPVPQQDEILNHMHRAVFGRPLITNVLRSLVVEAMVDLALGEDWLWCGADYFHYDFRHSSGFKLEVKQSAFKQSWATHQPSKPRFDIREREGYWDDAIVWVAQKGRAADGYLFALHTDVSDQADHRCADQWQFYLVQTRDLPMQKSIGLPWLLAHAHAVDITKLRMSADAICAQWQSD